MEEIIDEDDFDSPVDFPSMELEVTYDHLTDHGKEVAIERNGQYYVQIGKKNSPN